jgi:hypothetical protein
MRSEQQRLKGKQEIPLTGNFALAEITGVASNKKKINLFD